MLSDDIIPRLRSLLQSRGFTRSAICNYLGLHTNTLWRIDDDGWSPRLNTVRKIEGFVRRFERAKKKTLSGAGWRIDYQGSRWWIVVHGGENLGPFDDPDVALDASRQVIKPPP